MPDLVPLPGSEQAELPGAQPAGRLDENASIQVTLVLRRRAEVPRELITGPRTLTPAQFADGYGADPSDIDLVRSSLTARGLTVTNVHAGSRRLMVTGTLRDLAATFGTTLSRVTSEHPDGSGRVTHRYRSGGLSVPGELSGVVSAVLGLDDRPVARPHYRIAPDAIAPHVLAPEAVSQVKPVPLTALQVASAYGFPPGTDGTGQTIAIIELGGGYTTADLNTYFSGLGLATPPVSASSVNGGQNSPGQDADVEVMLDIEVAGAVAPKASQVVYFAPNTDQGFVDAVSDAAHATPTPTVISISWGGSEDSWAAQSRTALDSAIADAAVLGVTVTVAAGDNGSSDGASDGSVHCDFPASSPHALACGGTRLELSASGTIGSETVWNDNSPGGGASGGGATGGGFSGVFGIPSWQAAATAAGVRESALTGPLSHLRRHPKPAGPAEPPAPSGPHGRGVPDVAGNADPVTGYEIVAQGKDAVVGGTSAVAPLWAGLIARLSEAAGGTKFGLLQPRFYAGVRAGVAAAPFNDVTAGNNGAYSAGPGWDPCTGLGSPRGEALQTLLSSPA